MKFSTIIEIVCRAMHHLKFCVIGSSINNASLLYYKSCYRKKSASRSALLHYMLIFIT